MAVRQECCCKFLLSLPRGSKESLDYSPGRGELPLAGLEAVLFSGGPTKGREEMTGQMLPERGQFQTQIGHRGRFGFLLTWSIQLELRSFRLPEPPGSPAPQRPSAQGMRLDVEAPPVAAGGAVQATSLFRRQR